ncbi:type II toxin-antitoxin system RelE/ParE family toxin [Oceanibaculum nanhaiense]|uniref:type II toxin-antitoxin system RelE/ParE family toxin n=1 Tax=Oceanibaculum nanhaiense TaxID=1909734 RepID=UPI001FE5B2E2|nr:type II toxin-antitoxin system RelE/ParE family toxin [Oceanibaculum nanhaiense]
MTHPGYISIIETPRFIADAKSRLSSDERDALIVTLARNPAAGVLIDGGGGLRKLRVATGGRGKSAGARVIYYFYDHTVLVFLLTVFAKNEKADLSKRDLAILAKSCKALALRYGR